MTAFAPTDAQRQLIELDQGCHLVQAPPGTGKTQVLTHRIVHLLLRDAQATFRILGLTFTIKAAEQLRRRVRDATQDTANRVTACTFHSFCLDALQHYGHFIDFPPDTTVYDTDRDRLDVLSRALAEEGLAPEDEPALKRILSQIGVAKRALRSPDTIEDDGLRVAYAAYDRVLHKFHACDFDDLLWRMWRLLVDHPKVANHYRRMYRYIMIDEAQDTSRAQYEILRTLCGSDHRNVMMVADSEQFIYRFAGASDRWLDSFVEDFSAEVHHLTENFRCAEAIITAANKLLASQPSRPRKPAMSPATPAPGELNAASFPSEEEEARAVADWIEERLASGLSRGAIHPSESTALSPEDVCILCRNRYALTAVLAELEQRGVPHLFRAGRRLVETREAQLVLQGLKLVQNPADAVTRESVLAQWDPGLIDAGAAELPLREFFDRLGETNPVAAALTNDLRDLGPNVDVGPVIRAQLDSLSRFAESAAEAGEEDRALLLDGDASTLRDRWEAYAGHVAPEQRSFGGLLGELALAGRSVIEGEGVRVLTVHVAKGLEFKAVALVGMNEGTLPDYRSTHRQADLLDEYRIAYVAVTRASRTLFITRPRVRMMPWGDLKTQQESRFIAAMGLAMEHR